MTISELTELAIIGRNKVIEDRQKNVVSWLGQLPTEEQIKTVGNHIYHWIDGAYGPIYAQEICDPFQFSHKGE